MTVPRPGLPRWVAFAAIGLFLVYAANFLYFFVDDEAIPYVYAQNLLNGHGLTYNIVEGPVEGYSDFLHVWLCTLILAVVRGLHFSKILVFFVGKGVSLAAGAGIIGMTWAVLRRCGAATTGAAAGLGALALAGPLAAWSCSSLETVPFTLAVMALVWGLVTERNRFALIGAALVLLDRIDGFVYVGALVGAFMLISERDRRREIFHFIVLPLAGLFVVYHTWRTWYFHDLLPAPFEAKVLYKFTSHLGLIVKAPDEPYWLRMVRLYGWPAFAATVVAGGHAFSLGRIPRALVLAVAPLFLYVALVSDWMFGFRFFVPLLPLAALFVALSVSALGARRPRVAAAAALLAVMWSGVVAQRFVRAYKEAEHADSFIAAPSRDMNRFFLPYYGLLETARRFVAPGDRIAYNQAGFIPFMLDLTNYDDLGICSEFFAELPTTDVAFTEVGRYTPLTSRAAIGAGQAYLLHEDVRLVMSRTDLLTAANDGHVPRSVVGGYYELVATDPSGDNAIYRRTARSAERFHTDPSAFYENLAHVSHLRRALVDGVPVEPAQFGPRFPFLRERESALDIRGTFTLDLRFSAADVNVHGLSIDRIRAEPASTVQLELWSVGGRLVARRNAALAAGLPIGVDEEISGGVGANRLIMRLSPDGGGSGRVWVRDVRVQGQTPALRQYIGRRLKFGPPPSAGGF